MEDVVVGVVTTLILGVTIAAVCHYRTEAVRARKALNLLANGLAAMNKQRLRERSEAKQELADAQRAAEVKTGQLERCREALAGALEDAELWRQAQTTAVSQARMAAEAEAKRVMADSRAARAAAEAAREAAEAALFEAESNELKARAEAEEEAQKRRIAERLVTSQQRLIDRAGVEDEPETPPAEELEKTPPYPSPSTNGSKKAKGKESSVRRLDLAAHPHA